MNGLLLTFSDKFRPGDEIRFGDVAGFCTAMGWFDTHVRRYDESTVVVPNGKVMGVPVTNISRQTWSQYKTTIRLRLSDAEAAPDVVDAIRADLAAFADVVTTGRNLWVHWRAFEKDALAVTIDVKLAHGGGTRYHDAVQECNVRINRAVKRAGADFALPTSRRVE